MARILRVEDIERGGFFERALIPPAMQKRSRETRFRQEWVIPKWVYRCLMLGWTGDGDPKAWLLQRMQTLRKQGGFIGTGARKSSWSTGGGGGSVSLGAHFLTDFTSGGATQAYFTFGSDGSLDGNRLVRSNVAYAGEWWTAEPVTGIGSSYAVRHLSSGKTGTYNFTESAVADTWITMSADRSWGVSASMGGSNSCTATFEAGPAASGPADDSAVLYCEAYDTAGP